MLEITLLFIGLAVGVSALVALHDPLAHHAPKALAATAPARAPLVDTIAGWANSGISGRIRT